MTRTGYKMTEIGEIPEEWEVARLTNVADYINGYAFGPEDWKPKGLPIIRIQNLNDQVAEFNYFDEKIDEKYLVKNGDLLFAWSASIGCYLWNRGDAWLNQHIFKVVPKQGINKQFLYYELCMVIEQLLKKVHGSTMKHFKRGELKTTLIPLPEEEKEQQKIADILSTADDEIQKVNDQIGLTEKLKKGLMQQLLTKGIGHTKFKMTEIGEIPEEWEVTELGKLCIVLRNGLTYPQSSQSSYGIPITRIETISDGKISNKFGFLKELNENEISEYRLKKGDILFSHINSIEHIGKAAIYEGSPELLLHGMNLLLIRLNTNIADPFYYIQYLKYDNTRNRIRSLAKKAVNQASINQKELARLLMPVPLITEQQKIAEILSTVDEKINLLKTKKDNLEKVKKRLMDDLLTGKVRVKI